MEIRTLGTWMAELAHHGSEIEEEASKLVRQAGIKTQSFARQLCPVDTGVLRASISYSNPNGSETKPGDLAIQVGPTAEYGAYVEFGTSRSGAQPYMTPAAERIGPGFEQAIADLGEL